MMIVAFLALPVIVYTPALVMVMSLPSLRVQLSASEVSASCSISRSVNISLAEVVVALADSLTEACALPDTAEVLSAAEVPDEALLQAVKDAASTAAKMMAEIFLNIMYLPVR